MIVLIIVAGSLFGSLLVSYLHLWTVLPGAWPAVESMPALRYPIAAAGMVILSSVAIRYASRALENGADQRIRGALLAAVPLALGAFGLELYGLSETELTPTESGNGALVHVFVSIQGCYAALVSVMALYTFPRSKAGLLDAGRRATFDNTMLFWHYTVAQTLVGLAMVHGFPRLVG